MDYEQAQLVVLDYAMDLSIPPYISISSNVETISFCKWAVEELLQELKRKKHLPPVKVAKIFADKMFKYAANHSGSVFQVAYDVASDIYEIFNDIERRSEQYEITKNYT